MDINRLFVDTHHPHLRFVGDQGLVVGQVAAILLQRGPSAPAPPRQAVAFDGTTGVHPSVFGDFRSEDLMAWRLLMVFQWFLI